MTPRTRLLRRLSLAAVPAAVAAVLVAQPAANAVVSAPWAVMASPTLNTALGAAVTATGRWFLADRSMSGALEVQTWQAGSGWSQPTDLGGGMIGGPAAVLTPTGAVDLFVRGTTNALYERSWANGSWSGWVDLGGTLASRPAAVATPQGLAVFAAGTDGAVWMTRQGVTGWGPWTRVGGALLSGTGPAAVADPATGQLTVVAVQPDGHVYEASSLAPGVWGPFTAIGGSTSFSPAAVATGSGTHSVFVRSGNGATWEQSKTATGWTGWHSLGGQTTGSPAAARLGSQLRVFVIGPTPTLYANTSNAGSWSGYRPVVPPQPTSEPVASPSQYTTDLDGVASHDAPLGQSHGCSRARSGQPGLVILDYGRQMASGGAWGTEKLLSYGTFLSDADIVANAEAFLRGFRSCANGREIGLALALGTSNSSLGSNGSTQGNVWATKVVGPVAAYAAAQGYTGLNMTVAGASDIEPGFGGAYGAWTWVKAYNAATSLPYYDYGSADGCPGYGGGTACADGWSVANVWGPAAGLATSRMVPEIYTAPNEPLTQGSQWANISLWAAQHEGRPIPFAGEMTQYGACQQMGGCTYTGNTPAQGWSELYGNVESHPATRVPVFPFSTDIRYD